MTNSFDFSYPKINQNISEAHEFETHRGQVQIIEEEIKTSNVNGVVLSASRPSQDPSRQNVSSGL